MWGFSWRPRVASPFSSGFSPRIGALALTIFLVPAAMIHLAMRRQVMALEEKLRDGLTGKISFSARNDLDALGDLAALGHYTSALKNLSLIGPTAYLVLAGARAPMLIGFGPDWQLHGILTQL
jgi:hypothetical protein